MAHSTKEGDEGERESKEEREVQRRMHVPRELLPFLRFPLCTFDLVVRLYSMVLVGPCAIYFVSTKHNMRCEFLLGTVLQQIIGIAASVDMYAEYPLTGQDWILVCTSPPLSCSVPKPKLVQHHFVVLYQNPGPDSPRSTTEDAVGCVLVWKLHNIFGTHYSLMHESLCSVGLQLIFDCFILFYNANNLFFHREKEH